MKKSISVMLLCVCLSGCLPVLVGGIIWKSSKSSNEQKEFLQELNRLNLEREKAGLKPLDVCTEMYHFDPGWAQSNDDCKEKIAALIKAGVKPDSSKVFKDPAATATTKS